MRYEHLLPYLQQYRHQTYLMTTDKLANHEQAQIIIV